MDQTVSRRILASDLKRMMTKCKELYLEAHSEMKAVTITRKKMFHELVNHYEKEE